MKTKTVLIAYQDDLWARSLSTFFHGIGYRVETARMVSEMIRRVRKGSIQVVLLDDEIEGVKACDLVTLSDITIIKMPWQTVKYPANLFL